MGKWMFLIMVTCQLTAIAAEKVSLITTTNQDSINEGDQIKGYFYYHKRNVEFETAIAKYFGRRLNENLFLIKTGKAEPSDRNKDYFRIHVELVLLKDPKKRIVYFYSENKEWVIELPLFKIFGTKILNKKIFIADHLAQSNNRLIYLITIICFLVFILLFIKWKKKKINGDDNQLDIFNLMLKNANTREDFEEVHSFSRRLFSNPQNRPSTHVEKLLVVINESQYKKEWPTDIFQQIFEYKKNIRLGQRDTNGV